MKNEGTKYEFSGAAYQHSSQDNMCGWTFVSLPKELAEEIRDRFKHREEGWGRMKVRAQTGKSEWQTAIWFDKKHDTYLLPLKAEIRKKEKIHTDQEVKVTLWI